MNRKYWNRSAALAAVCAVLWIATPLGIPAAQAAKDKAESKGKTDAATLAKLLRVAVLPVVNRSADVDASKILGDVLGERLKEVDRSKGIFLQPGDVERTLASQDGLDRALRITDRWAKDGALDSTAIAGLDSILVADAVLCIKIAEWETKRYHNIGEGQSNTTIGLNFTLFGIRDMKRIWSKDVREQRLAPEVDISTTSVGIDATGRIQSANVNDPPRVQDVASDLVKDAFKKFPIK